jgi:CBS domain-containing protein
MTKNVSSVQSGDSLSKAAKIMWDCDCGAIPVVEDGGRAVGMITDRDICMAAWTQDRALSTISIPQAMSQAIYSCSPDDSLAAAEEVMRSRQVRRLPVLDAEGRLQGIISLADIVRAAERDQGRRTKDVVSDEVASTLAHICQPRAAGQAVPAS